MLAEWNDDMKEYKLIDRRKRFSWRFELYIHVICILRDRIKSYFSSIMNSLLKDEINIYQLGGESSVVINIQDVYIFKLKFTKLLCIFLFLI